jgi:hypothetical protein
MQLFENTVKLRGFLGADAEAPSSGNLKNDSFGVLLLVTVSGVWDLGYNEWHPRTDLHRIICPGAYFCGLVRGMRRGDYLEVEGEIRGREEDRTVVVAGKRSVAKHAVYGVHAIRITRLGRPDALVDFGESDDYNEQQSSEEGQP